MKRTKRALKKAKPVAARKSSWPPGWTEELELEFQEAGPHVYDKAKWHYEGDFPKGLPKEQAFVHTGLFVGWLLENDLISRHFMREFGRELRSVANDFKRRKITGPEAYDAWGGCLGSEMLTAEGNEFADKYYDGTAFATDYRNLLAHGLPSFYHVENTWANYQILKRRIDERFKAWKKRQRKMEKERQKKKH